MWWASAQHLQRVVTTSFGYEIIADNISYLVLASECSVMSRFMCVVAVKCVKKLVPQGDHWPNIAFGRQAWCAVFFVSQREGIRRCAVLPKLVQQQPTTTKYYKFLKLKMWVHFPKAAEQRREWFKQILQLRRMSEVLQQRAKVNHMLKSNKFYYGLDPQGTIERRKANFSLHGILMNEVFIQMKKGNCK